MKTSLSARMARICSGFPQKAQPARSGGSAFYPAIARRRLWPYRVTVSWSTRNITANEQIGFGCFEIKKKRFPPARRHELSRAQHPIGRRSKAPVVREYRPARSRRKTDRINTRLCQCHHELRTPLNIILGYTHDTQLLPALMPELPASYKNFQHIHRTPDTCSA
jgi:signal transduction histidine kinase